MKTRLSLVFALVIPTVRLCGIAEAASGDKEDKPAIVYRGTNMTFSVARDGVLHISGTGLKTVWPDGREPERKLSRHSHELIPLKPGERKRSVVVKDSVHWTNLKLARLIELTEKAITLSERFIKNKTSIESCEIHKNMELVGDRLGGSSLSLRSQAGLEGVPRIKARTLTKQGNLVFLVITVYSSDGSANSDLTELTEELNLAQQQALLRALKNIPRDEPE